MGAEKGRGDPAMKRMEPNLRQPIESGDLLYDLVLAQQADEEELKNTFY